MIIFKILLDAGLRPEDAAAIRDALGGGALNVGAVGRLETARRIWIAERDRIDAQFDRLLQRPVASVKAGGIEGSATVRRSARTQTKMLGKTPGAKHT